MRALVCGMLLMMAVVSCGGASKSQIISIDDFPKDLLAIAKEKLPGVTFDQALRKGNGDLEVRGKDPKGKIRDIEFSKTGEIVEIE